MTYDGHASLGRAPMTGPATETTVPRVWQFHAHVFHYRLPVWDLMLKESAGRYRLTVLGHTEEGRAFGGESRRYIRHLAHDKAIGPFFRFKDAVPLVKEQRPEILMIQNSPRNLSLWRLPRICHGYGGVTIAWNKVRSYSKTPKPILDFMKRRLFRMYDLFVVYGHSAAAELVELGYPEDRILVAQNTIDTRRIFESGEAMKSRGLELKARHGLGDRRILLCIARFDAVKRHRDLIAAWPRIRAAHPDTTLVLAGSGSLEAELRAQAARVAPEGVLFLGPIPEGDDYAWISVADATIQCGQIGLGINQSMAFGTPTIIADEPGPDSEILQHEITGWRYPKGDLDGLVGVANSVLSGVAGNTDITQRAQRLMQSEVTIENMVSVLNEAIYRATDLLEARRR